MKDLIITEQIANGIKECRGSPKTTRVLIRRNGAKRAQMVETRIGSNGLAEAKQFMELYGENLYRWNDRTYVLISEEDNSVKAVITIE